MDVVRKSDRKVVCMFCGEELMFVEGKGWVHKSDGKLYKTRQMNAKEIERFIRIHKRPPSDFEKIIDDHCAHPKFVE